jgi:hypothetical protein
MLAVAGRAKLDPSSTPPRTTAWSKVLVLDEWPDRASFEAFAEEQASQIEPMLEAARATETSEPTFWRELTTHEAVGWGA